MKTSNAVKLLWTAPDKLKYLIWHFMCEILQQKSDLQNAVFLEYSQDYSNKVHQQ